MNQPVLEGPAARVRRTQPWVYSVYVREGRRMALVRYLGHEYLETQNRVSTVYGRSLSWDLGLEKESKPHTLT